MKYTNAQKSFHWLTAILILGMVGSGLAYSYDLADKGALIGHQIMGQMLIVLLLLRLFVRVTRRTPSVPPHHPVWERAFAAIVHIALYACLIAFVITGYVSASALRDTALLFPADQGFARSDTGEMLLETHFLLKWVLLGLLTAHISGALKHMFWDRDDTLSHMTFPSRKDI